MPRRSTGCEKCRQRKVRCDEGKPQCQNCAQYGVECPGYRPPADKDLRFVNQTNHSAFESLREMPPVTAKSGRPYKWRYLFPEPTSIGNPNDISKRHVHRTQLLSTFLDLYLPENRDMSMMSNFSYIANLPFEDISSPLLQASIDTLCLVELGSLYEDDRCIRESRARYVRALPMLARELRKIPSKQMRKDHILAAIAILGLCELFSALSQGDDGWISHTNGAQQYLKANRRECLESPLGWLLFHNLRHSSLSMWFVNRKKTFFAEPEWLKVTEDMAKTDPFIALHDIALQVPGILGQRDIIFETVCSAQDVVEFCRDICILRVRLKDWLQKHYIDSGKELYSIVAIRDMTTFANLCLDRTFQTAFRFPSVQVCNQLQLYWITCLYLDFTLLDAYRKSRDIDEIRQLIFGDFTNRDEEDIERDLFVHATNYCRTIPYCCEPESSSPGRMGGFLIQVVQRYFELFGHCNETEWCKSVRRVLIMDPATEMESATSQIPGSAFASAQCNVKHRCKSPICNFRVECSAPAPLLLPDELLKIGYAPSHPPI